MNNYYVPYLRKIPQNTNQSSFPILLGIAVSILLSIFAYSQNPQNITLNKIPITTLGQLLEMNPSSTDVLQLDITATLLWKNSDDNTIVLWDGTNFSELELKLPPYTPPCGTKVHIRTVGVASKSGNRYIFQGSRPIIDNDGIHSTIEKIGHVYLENSCYPINLLWFNAQDLAELQIEMSGPGLPRTPIPSSYLHHSTGNHLRQGILRTAFPHRGELLPRNWDASPIQTANVETFTLEGLPYTNDVAVLFSGFLHIPQAGIYTFYLSSDDGSKLIIDLPPADIELVGPGQLPPAIDLAKLDPSLITNQLYFGTISGRVEAIRTRTTSWELDLSFGTQHATVVSPNPLKIDYSLLGTLVTATGTCVMAYSASGKLLPGYLLLPDVSWLRVEKLPNPVFQSPDPKSQTITEAAKVHQLTREQAQSHIPVEIKGVVTCVLPEHQAFTVHDRTRGIYVVDQTPSGIGTPSIGELLLIKGKTDAGLFAPIVNAHEILNLGRGFLPPPIHPTWDMINNGSLDAQLVELRGVIVDAHTNLVKLKTPAGTLEIELRANVPQSDKLADFRDALVRLRGCLFATWDYSTHTVIPGKIKLYNADIIVEKLPPTNLFNVPEKSVAQLAQFDPEATSLQLTRITAIATFSTSQLICAVQGSNSIRILLREPCVVNPGDLIEAVGYPELTLTYAPTLSAAVVRRIGTASVPPARIVPPDRLHDPSYDASFIQIDGTLIAYRKHMSELLLDLQEGPRTFTARIFGAQHSHSTPKVGSKLRIKGVLLFPPTTTPAQEDKFGELELLVPTAEFVQIISNPPILTRQRLKYLLLALAATLVAATLWIFQLQRIVNQKTLELANSIQQRQIAEQKQAIERERTRIARDLHDELGSGLTEIGMLAIRAADPTVTSIKQHQYLTQIHQRAKELVTSLEEIVWATSPHHDTVGSLATYLSIYAERFCESSNLKCQIERQPELPHANLPAHVRHDLFMAFKEILNNVAKHARASQIVIQFAYTPPTLTITIIDDGIGFDLRKAENQGNGLRNIKSRIERIGGEFLLWSSPGTGTKAELSIRVPIHEL